MLEHRRRVLLADVAIRDVAWLDDDRLVATDASAAVWRVDLPSGEGDGEVTAVRLHRGEEILGPLSAALGSDLTSPADGTYPQLDVGRDGTLVVCTHDLVLAVCPARTGRWTPVLTCWGQYYPRISFSADGRFALAQADVAYAFDCATGRPLADLRAELAVWHPTRSHLLCYRAGHELAELDLAGLDPAEPQAPTRQEPTAAGTAQLRAAERSWGLASWGPHPAAAPEWLVPDLLLWDGDAVDAVVGDALFPVGRAGGSEARLHFDLGADLDPDGHGGLWERRGDGSYAHWSRRGRPWHVDARLPAGLSRPRLSPNGTRWLALDRLPVNPYPLRPPPDQMRRIHLSSGGSSNQPK